MKSIPTAATANGDRINELEAALYRGRIGRREFLRGALAAGLSLPLAQAMAQDGTDAAITQLYNARNLRTEYDFIVVGSGSGGAVVAGRLAAETDARILVLEAGGTDQVPAVRNPGLWPTNIRSERDWGHSAAAATSVNNRSLILPMGKIVGGGSSINASVWARGHKNDFDSWAHETGDDGWSYARVLDIYRRIEDWQGVADPARRGKGGRLWVEPARNPNPIAEAMLDAAAAAGIPKFADQNGAMMEGDGGVAIANLRIRDGQRRNLPSDYLYAALKRPNITLLTGAEVQSLTLEGSKVTGVRFLRNGQVQTVRAARRVVLSAGAINTPKILMLSGIGDEAELKRHGIRTVARLPGVGRNFQDHVLVGGCVWEYDKPLPPANNAAEATFFWKSDASLPTPDLQPFQIEVPFTSEVTGPRFKTPAGSWTIAPGLVRPKSRGRVKLASSNPADMALVDGAFLSHADDVKALLRGIELCREIGNSAGMKGFVKREVMPGPLGRDDMTAFLRDAAGTYFHQSCTCKMGRDEMSVVDGQLSVRGGIEGLSIADASVMPSVSTGNTMAPTVIIGERMADILIARR
ncbi:MAG: GMC family oxidoreductase N-terminal domain-containing protein [Sphaerotilus natans subsp. sulfidivorans]|uniref:GMC family oxidoreductase n=1 Tax=Sphaerotilus sulfidivorans TaxID=639200 RepID=UPI002356F6E2|nr:GMC family oxidoreductase N-terminal domain-containing protein [Sphaerotilus sulfidivorans]MCK6400702.1 GMC family oxidoreductase N-terminal domain-containing protein [Sphaerotilus sulfidivorans]